MSAVQCSGCVHITRHRSASQAMYTTKHGFSGCAKQPAYVYFSRLYERECADFVAKGQMALQPEVRK